MVNYKLYINTHYVNHYTLKTKPFQFSKQDTYTYNITTITSMIEAMSLVKFSSEVFRKFMLARFKNAQPWYHEKKKEMTQASASVCHILATTLKICRSALTCSATCELKFHVQSRCLKRFKINSNFSVTCRLVFRCSYDTFICLPTTQY